MRKLTAILIILVAATVRADTNGWVVASVNTEARFKIHFFVGGLDGRLGHDVMITDFIPSPRGITVIRPQHRQTWMFGSGRPMNFRIHPRITALLSNRVTSATQTVHITSRAEDTVTLGTNSYWIVDIRTNSCPVVLKHIGSGHITNLTRLKGEQSVAPVTSKPAAFQATASEAGER